MFWISFEFGNFILCVHHSIYVEVFCVHCCNIPCMPAIDDLVCTYTILFLLFELIFFRDCSSWLYHGQLSLKGVFDNFIGACFSKDFATNNLNFDISSSKFPLTRFIESRFISFIISVMLAFLKSLYFICLVTIFVFGILHVQVMMQWSDI